VFPSPKRRGEEGKEGTSLFPFQKGGRKERKRQILGMEKEGRAELISHHEKRKKKRRFLLLITPWEKGENIKKEKK